jgi:hypothetical protein
MELGPMRSLKVLLTCFLVLQLLGAAFILVDVNADALPPEITNIYPVPKYPQTGDDITIYATIIDPDGVQTARVTYCVDLCYMKNMDGPDANDVYWANITWDDSWGPGASLYYEVYAKDTASNSITTQKIWLTYVSGINLTVDSKDSVFLGEPIILTGSAQYDQNESAPVETSEVTIRVTYPDTFDSYLYTFTDTEGNLSQELMFTAAGEYTINVTITNRSLSASREFTVIVMDIPYFTQKVQMTTCYPDQQMWINGTARYNTDDPVVNSDIQIKINETLFWSGKTDSEGNYSILVTVPSEIGDYTLNASVVNGTLTCYNETSITVVAVPLPDLAISSEDTTVDSEYSPAIEGQEINITVVIENLGLADCSDITLKIYNGLPGEGNLLSENDFTQISCGGHATFSLFWTPLNGTYELWVLVDPDNEIEESFEDNNNITVPIFIDNDLDNDTIGDTVDLDDDGDGTNDDEDDFPQNPNEWLDTDTDGIGNNADLDDDNDGLSDSEELEKKTDPLDADSDDDGVNDFDDYAPLNAKITQKPDDPDELPWIFLFLIVIIVVVLVIFAMIFSKRKKK